MKAQSDTIETPARPQSFPLVNGEIYHVLPPAIRRPGVIYLTGFSRLLEITADGRARFEPEDGGESFTIRLGEDRIRKY